ncbi:hypothetical protein CEK25_009368 [Fusarium fujikuroi]|nr:hypothetical protein CEK25_009368 [Fusarium fujikuroi]
MAEQPQSTPATDIPPGPHSSRVAPIQKLIQQWTPLRHPTKSPEEKYQERHKEAQAHLEVAAASACVQSDAARLDALQSCIDQLKELQAEREANKDDEEIKYQELYWEQQEALILGLLDTVGPKLGDKVCNKWRQRTQLPVNSSAQSNAPAGSSSEVTTNTSYCTPNASPVMQSFRLPNPRPRSYFLLPTNTLNQETHTIPQTKANNPRKPRQKRPANPTLPTPEASSNQETLATERSFNEVYQDGHAQRNT